jgi:hypothetical protein
MTTNVSPGKAVNVTAVLRSVHAGLRAHRDLLKRLLAAKDDSDLMPWDGGRELLGVKVLADLVAITARVEHLRDLLGDGEPPLPLG